MVDTCLCLQLTSNPYFTSTCRYSSALGQGVCDVCEDHTTGASCELCQARFYRNPTNVNVINEQDPTGDTTCLACACDAAGAVNGTLTSCVQYPPTVSGAPGLGQCACKSNTRGRACSECAPQTYALSASNADGCTSCACDARGSLNNNCNVNTGVCECRARTTGPTCDVCVSGYTNLSSSHADGCVLCRTSGPTITIGGSPAQLFMTSNPATNACLPCHPQCNQGCSSTLNASSCTACRGLAMGSTGACVEFCPDNTFADTQTGLCLPCHSTCRVTGNCRSSGDTCSCTGPTRNDCDECVGFTILVASNVTGGATGYQCLDANATCPVAM